MPLILKDLTDQKSYPERSRFSDARHCDQKLHVSRPTPLNHAFSVVESHLTCLAAGGRRRIKMTECDSHIEKPNLLARGRGRCVVRVFAGTPRGGGGHDGQGFYPLLGWYGSC
jgi:hypothetical protein